MTSLEKRCQQLLAGNKEDNKQEKQDGVSPASTLTDSLGEEDEENNSNNNNNKEDGKDVMRNGRMSADSMASIISGLSDSPSNADGSSRRHSLITKQLSNNVRRSSRLSTRGIHHQQQLGQLQLREDDEERGGTMMMLNSARLAENGGDLKSVILVCTT